MDIETKDRIVLAGERLVYMALWLACAAFTVVLALELLGVNWSGAGWQWGSEGTCFTTPDGIEC